MKNRIKNCVTLGAAMTMVFATVTAFALDNNQNSTTGNSQPVRPDNSKVNERDRNGENVTAGDQSNTEADRKITQAIRRAIVKDENLSTVAKNIKIITIDGNVTLRGPVNTEAEKTQIADLATKAAAPAKVNNQLEVKGESSKDAPAQSTTSSTTTSAPSQTTTTK